MKYRDWLFAPPTNGSWALVFIPPGRRRDHLVFLNIDDEVHTATVRLAGAFPPNAMKATGHNISDAWSTGDLKANGESSPIFADKAGKYTYGCVHHFAGGMQATIVVEP